MIPPSRLLKSWARPPQSWPTASIFWLWRRWSFCVAILWRLRTITSVIACRSSVAVSISWVAHGRAPLWRSSVDGSNDAQGIPFCLVGLPPRCRSTGRPGRSQNRRSHRSSVRKAARRPLASLGSGAIPGAASARFSVANTGPAGASRLSHSTRRHTSALSGRAPNDVTSVPRTRAAPLAPNMSSAVTSPFVSAGTRSSAWAMFVMRLDSRRCSCRRTSSCAARSAGNTRWENASMMASAAARCPGEVRCGSRWWQMTRPHSSPSTMTLMDIVPSTPRLR